MTQYWYEANNSREGSFQAKDGRRTYRYKVIGTLSDLTAYGIALSQLSTFDSAGFILHDIAVSPLAITPVEADCAFDITATYVHPESEEAKEAQSERLETGDCDWTWRASTTTETLTHALHQTEYPGGLVDDAGVLKRAIEATDAGDVKGVPVPVPQLEILIWKYFPRNLIKGAQGVQFVKNLTSQFGCSNSQPWWGFNRGELVLTHAEPEERGVKDVKVTLTMSCQANRKNIDFGNVGNANVVVPEKRGAQYLWVYHKRSAADNGLEMVPKPWRVCVADVVPEVDFSTFGFPNAPP